LDTGGAELEVTQRDPTATMSPRRKILLASTAGLMAALCVVLAVGCSKTKGCDGPALKQEQLLSLRRSAMGTQGSGGGKASAFLVLPNPIDATEINGVMASDSRVVDAGNQLGLPSLSMPSLLENGFVKVRIRSVEDDLSTLAKPDSKGRYNFEITDVHYSEALAYYSVVEMIRYVETMGFTVAKERPLYVMVRAEGPGGSDEEPNAIYDHNYLNPSLPRTMRLYGNSKFAPGMDAEMYRHEFGHLFNESASGQVGIDFAGDNGAVYTEGAALHECLADYLALSYGNKPTIGKWLARNLKGFAPGEPLRSLEDTGGKMLRFADVAVNDGRRGPERYAVAEWCGRVLWEIRKSFLEDDRAVGALRSDRVVFTALSRLRRDTSILQFANELLKADDKLHCGGHRETIVSAFEGRGFSFDVEPITRPVGMTARPFGYTVKDGKVTTSSPKAGASVAFDLRITNPNSTVARNVRVRLEADSGSGFFVTKYMQGFGDLAPGATVVVGEGGLSYASSVAGELDQDASKGARIRYRLRVLVENGAGAQQEGEISL